MSGPFCTARSRKTPVLGPRSNGQVFGTVVLRVVVAVADVLAIPLIDLASLHHLGSGRVPRSTVLLLLRASMVVVVL